MKCCSYTKHWTHGMWDGRMGRKKAFSREYNVKLYMTGIHKGNSVIPMLFCSHILEKTEVG